MASRGVLETENRLAAILESNKDESKMSERDCKYKVVISCDGCIKCDSINRNQFDSKIAANLFSVSSTPRLAIHSFISNVWSLRNVGNSLDV
jgi:hypothetical protein